MLHTRFGKAVISVGGMLEELRYLARVCRDMTPRHRAHAVLRRVTCPFPHVLVVSHKERSLTPGAPLGMQTP